MYAFALLVTVVSAEVAARIDDWIVFGVTPWAVVERERDLMLRDTWGTRGRPNGRFNKFKLNSFGFRGPEISHLKPPGTVRVMVLGASETFGLYESEGHEFPALLRTLIAVRHENVEVVNAAVAGMSLPRLLTYWQRWVSTFEPDLVLLYPSPHLYLDTGGPPILDAAPPSPLPPLAFRLRLQDRVIAAMRPFKLAKILRARYLLRQELSQHDEDWVFHEVPRDRLARFAGDLRRLGDSIADRGARPVLLTHASAISSPVRSADITFLEPFRVLYPRVTAEILQKFEASTAAETIRLATARKWHAIDLASHLSGSRSLFVDPVHFNDAGSAAAASLLAAGLEPLLAGAGSDR
jgi:hypothetical protein